MSTHHDCKHGKSCWQHCPECDAEASTAKLDPPCEECIQDDCLGCCEIDEPPVTYQRIDLDVPISADTDVKKQIIAQAVTNTLTNKWEELRKTCPWCNGGSALRHATCGGTGDLCTLDTCAVMHFMKGGL